jgi:aminoglycoside 6'-N-acetyltransferase I
MPSFHIRPVTPADAATWERLRTAHWPDGAADHAPEIAVFFAEHGGQAVAVMELSIRTDLPPLRNVKVGYVEGFYIVPEFRGHGLARQLLRFAQQWARQQHCTGFASDRAGRLILDPHYHLP